MRSNSKHNIEVIWDGEAFKNMIELRTLVIKGVSFSESPTHLPNSLRVVEWKEYPSECFPVDFYQRQLTICKLTSKFYCREGFFKKASVIQINIFYNIYNNFFFLLSFQW